MGDLGLIPGLGRSPGEGICYPLQYSWASLVAQTVKNLPATWETWVQSLGWEFRAAGGGHDNPLQYSYLDPMDRGAWQTTVHGSQKVGYTTEQITHTHAFLNVGDTLQVLNIYISQRLKTQGVESDKYV